VSVVVDAPLDEKVLQVKSTASSGLFRTNTVSSGLSQGFFSVACLSFISILLAIGNGKTFLRQL
jgi:hypothetical protein